MRGLLILSLLLGVLYYGFLSKEDAEQQIPLLRSIKIQASGIAQRESDRAFAAKECNGGDDESAVECLIESYEEPAAEEDYDSSDDEYSNTKRSRNKPASSRAVSKRIHKFSGGSEIQGF